MRNTSRLTKVRWRIEDADLSIHGLLAMTSCKLGWHCRPRNGIRKFGRQRLLCRHCRTVIGTWD